jgi:hypothetical protein
MDSRIFCAYNETSKCFLSTRVTVVDAALEPLKVLKVLMEGLGPDAKAGLWLIHFKGVPVARALSPFDLIYLDKDFKVVHGVELSVDSNFEPFRGQPSSALILPSKTLTAAKTRSGHQVNFREVYDPAAQSSAISQPSASQRPPVPDAPPSQGAGVNVLNSAFAGLAIQGASSPGGQGAVMKSADSAAPIASASAEAAPASSGSGSISSGRLTKSVPAMQPARPGLERPPIANIPSRVVPASAAKSINVPPEMGSSGRSANAALSGRLMRSAPAHPEMSAVPQQSLPAVREPEEALPAPDSVEQPTHGTVIPFPAAPVQAEMLEMEAQSSQNPPPGTPPPFKWDELQVPPPIALGPLAPELESAAKDPQTRDSRQDSALVPASQVKKSVSWDVRLLYWVFPEYDPAQAPDYRMPRADFLNEAKSRAGEPSKKLQLLSWLYPDLHLERVEKTRREERAATRLSEPGLVAYFFTGGSPRPHEVKNISVSGFYMYTDERWLPGTIIRITLQILGSSGDDPRDTITVHSRVVRWGVDGGGFEFVLPGFIDD